MPSCLSRRPAAPRRIRLLGLGVLLGAFALAPRAFGQEIDETARSTARQLAGEGSELYEQQNFEQAYDRFARAYALVHAPTVGLWAARSLQKLGRFVEASERFLELLRQPLPEGAPPEHEKARADAAAERQALLPRIPSLRVVVEGADPNDVFVTVNGELLPAPLIGVGRPVNPGQLAVKGTRGADVVEANLELVEGESRDVKLTFRPLAPAPVPVVAAPIASEAPPAPLENADPGSAQRTLGYVALGVGGAGLAVGTIFGVLALNQKSELDAACPERSCPPSEYGELDTYETRSTLSGVGLIGGALLAAGGVALVLTAPTRARAERALPRLGLRLSVGEARLFGELP